MGDTTAAPDEASEATAPTETPATGSRREEWVARVKRMPGGRIALAVAVLCALATGWGITGRQMGQSVEVTQGDVTCTGTKLATRPAGPDDTPTPTMWLKPGMRCVLPVHLRNTGALGVSLTSLRLPLMGPRGGAAVQVTHVGHAKAEKDQIDGVYPLSRSLAAGEELTLRVVFVFRKDGCTDAGDSDLDRERCPRWASAPSASAPPSVPTAPSPSAGPPRAPARTESYPAPFVAPERPPAEPRRPAERRTRPHPSPRATTLGQRDTSHIDGRIDRHASHTGKG